MSVDRVVLNWGCPRSGTTFMRKALQSLDGAFTFKLAESRALHPCRSAEGLLWLARMWHKEHPVFVRTVRHPLEVAESFEAARTVHADRTPGLAKNTDVDVLRWIRTESENWAAQKQAVEDAGARVVEVRYECLPGDAYRTRVAEAVTEGMPAAKSRSRALVAALCNFGVKPARTGRLSTGLDGVLSPERRAMYREELRDVMRREGYDEHDWRDTEP